jgi:hypothetical protein
LVTVLSVLRFTESDYLLGIFNVWLLYCLSFVLLSLITSLVSSTFGYCIVRPSFY